jgi:ribosome-binding protein aMBF1 (putative translation factor)
MKNEMTASKTHKNTVTNMLKNAETNPNKIDTIYNNELDKQNETFKQRLEEKRKKMLLSTSDLTEQIEVMVKV